MSKSFVSPQLQATLSFIYGTQNLPPIKKKEAEAEQVGDVALFHPVFSDINGYGEQLSQNQPFPFQRRLLGEPFPVVSIALLVISFQKNRAIERCSTQSHSAPPANQRYSTQEALQPPNVPSFSLINMLMYARSAGRMQTRSL